MKICCNFPLCKIWKNHDSIFDNNWFLILFDNNRLEIYTYLFYFDKLYVDPGKIL